MTEEEFEYCEQAERQKHDEKVKELEKENTELKEKLKPENCLKYLARGGYVKFFCEYGNEHDQLTKAKEIILNILNNFAYPIGREDWTEEDIDIVEQAEDFIKE